MEKKAQFQLLPNRTYPIQLGTIVKVGQIDFAMKMNCSDCGIILYTKEERIKVPFPVECKIGNVYSGSIKGVSLDLLEGYNYYEGDHIFVDPYARKVLGNEIFGQDYQIINCEERKGAIVSKHFQWDEDCNPKLPYEESIQYLIHVRGFTKHASSKVKEKGTFQGVIEKIPYLQELGITSLEVMPCYEFEEVEVEDSDSMAYAVKHYKEMLVDQPKQKLNCWGYKEANYFAPKSSYSSKVDCVSELKELIKELHLAGIEFIMQLYFPKNTSYKFICDVMAYWILEYHIDGIHLMGEGISLALIAKESLFQDVKIMYEYINYDELNGKVGTHEHMAIYHGDFMKHARRFLKGEPGSIGGFIEALKIQDSRIGRIQYVSNYNEFTLHDMVTYDYKHNEANGEDNEDGTFYNYSWNHGIEGVTKKKKVVEIRERQMKNAMTYLLLAQGTPMIMAGDEFAFSRQGNNNPYCHDNELLWLDWEGAQKNQELFVYIKELIAFRKENPIFHPERNFKMADVLGCGYPELSYHGEEAWKPNLGSASFCIGLLYCGAYEQGKEEKVQSDYYVAYNSYWEKRKLALPRLKEGYEWRVVMSSNKSIEREEASLVEGDMIQGDIIQLEERCVCIIKSVEVK